MLVLSRREGEEFLFPELDIVVRVLKVRGRTISIGIDAPNEFRIARGELAPKENCERKAPRRTLEAKGPMESARVKRKRNPNPGSKPEVVRAAG